MPKRVIHGEALYRSDKLAKVQPPRYRSEYANLLPLALANGVFEADPRKVWCQVYSYNRPDYAPDDVEYMLNEFERVGMLFRWRESDEKMWGYFIGINKPGRLPGLSRQGKNEAVGPNPPMDSIRKFLDSNGIHEALNGNEKHLGSGSGSGSGLGSGSGKTLRDESANGADTPQGNGTGVLDLAEPSNGKVKNTPPTKNTSPSLAAARLAALLRDEILRNKPDAQITNTQVGKWGKVADLMLRIDKRSEQNIAAVIRWAQGNEFWMPNILSMGKLREKFDELELKSGAKRRISRAAAVGVHQPPPPETPTEWSVDEPVDAEAGKKLWESAKPNVRNLVADKVAFDSQLRPLPCVGLGKNTGTLYLGLLTKAHADGLDRFNAALREVLGKVPYDFVSKDHPEGSHA